VEKRAYPYQAEATLPTGKRMIDQVLQGLRGKEYTPAERTQYLEWAENLGKGRIEHIVNNKFRKAYGRAAEVLGALAEYFILTDHQEHALSLITHYRDVQFTRYPAFKSEVNQVIASSKILAKLARKK
jgi:benzoyl-CoA reductase/2-hydroxyglutaryl-CoA dehydratase subunit BcrC/BadD/HgdB